MVITHQQIGDVYVIWTMNATPSNHKIYHFTLFLVVLSFSLSPCVRMMDDLLMVVIFFLFFSLSYLEKVCICPLCFLVF